MRTFLSVPAIAPTQAAAGQIVLLGAPEATPYEPGKASHSRNAPAAIRAALARQADWLDHYDFDLGRTLAESHDGRVADAGDVAGSPDTPGENRAAIAEAVGRILANGATPVVLGGDDSVPIPFLAAFDGHGPIWVVQVDAHIDWRHERFGETMGWSSPMRRASEMAWVEGMVQVGIRGLGSALPADLEDATAWGSKIVTARDVFRAGMDAALRHIPAGARVVISLDLDGLDPAVMPGVLARAPGGLTYWQMIDLLDGLAETRAIAGCAIVELAPERDVDGISALTAARIACNVIDAVQRSKANAGG
jgi:agmatinase